MTNQNKDETQAVQAIPSSGGKIVWYLSFVLILPLLLHIIFRNSFIRYQAKINELSSDIDVQLKKRKDTLIKLVDSAKSYVKYEKGLLSDITKLRKMNVSSDYGKSSDHMNSMFGKFQAVAENYPDLKAAKLIQELMEQSAYLEREIAASRRLYNSSVNIFNQNILVWPKNIISSSMHLTKRKYFEISESDRKDVDTKIF